MRKFKGNEHADMNMILAAIVMAITFSIGIVIVFNVVASVDSTTIDADLDGTPSANATDDLLDNLNTFYTVGPIILIVVAAVGILSYVMLLRRT